MHNLKLSEFITDAALRRRLLVTLAALALVRLLAHLPCPGVPLEVAALFAGLSRQPGLSWSTALTGSAPHALGALGLLPFLVVVGSLSLAGLWRPAWRARLLVADSVWPWPTRRALIAVAVLGWAWGWLDLASLRWMIHWYSFQGLLEYAGPLSWWRLLLGSMALSGAVFMQLGVVAWINRRGLGHGILLVLGANVLCAVPDAIIALGAYWRECHALGIEFWKLQLLAVAVSVPLVARAVVLLALGQWRFQRRPTGESAPTGSTVAVTAPAVLTALFATCALSSVVGLFLLAAYQYLPSTVWSWVVSAVVAWYGEALWFPAILGVVIGCAAVAQARLAAPADPATAPPAGVAASMAGPSLSIRWPLIVAATVALWLLWVGPACLLALIDLPAVPIRYLVGPYVLVPLGATIAVLQDVAVARVGQSSAAPLE